MAAHLLVTVPVLLLGAFLILRCLIAWGVPVRLPRALAVCPEAAPAPESAGKRRLWKVFLWALGLRLALWIAAAACVALNAGGKVSPEEILRRLCQWDGMHYVNLVDKGYSGYIENDQHLFLVFFPCYVWVTKLFRLVIPNTAAAGVLVSALSYAWGCCWVYRLAEEFSGPDTARDSVLLLSLFPFSFFYGSVMTEGLFLLTTSAACWCAVKEKWLGYSLWGICAAMTRMAGILVIVPAAVELLRRERPLAPPVKESLGRSWKRLLLRVPALLAPLLGTAAYLLLNWRVDGDPFAFVTHQRHWYQGGMWISGVIEYLWSYLKANFWTSNGWAIWLPELTLFLVSFLVLVLAARRETSPPSLLLYGFLYLVINYSLSWLLSAGRYLSCGFMLFILAAQLLKKRPALRSLILAVEAVLMGVYLNAYLAGAQIM